MTDMEIPQERHCGMSRPTGYHPRHKYMLGRQVHQCCGTIQEDLATEGSEILPAAIEAAAQALFDEQEGSFVQPDHPWLTTFESGRRAKYTRRAIRALEAAQPHLLAEVKVLTETATRVALELGRREAQQAIQALAELVELKDGPRDAGYEHRKPLAWQTAREILRSLASLPSGATSDATSGVPESSEVGSESQAVSNRLPQEPCGHPTCPCAEGSTS